MKNWQKVSLALLAILMVMVIGTSFLVKKYLAPETVKALIIPALEETIRHTISFSTLEVGLRGTIKLKDITISDPTSPQYTPLIQCKKMALHCRILPLLKKKIIIEKITLHQPHLNLVRDVQGNYNFTKHTPATEQKAIEKEKVARTTSETTLSITVTYLNIKNGTLTFTDYSKTSSEPFQLTAKDIDLRASQISAISSFPLKLSAEILSTPPAFLTLKALIDPAQREVESRVELTPLDITYFAPYFPTLPFTLLKGYCALNLTLVAHKSLDLSSQGLISLKDITLSPVGATTDTPPHTFIESLRNITIDLDHRVSYQHAEDTLVLEKLNATLHEIKCSLSGKVEKCKTHPLLDVALETGKLSVHSILDSIPPDLLPGWSDLLASGTTEAHLSIKGTLKKPKEWETNGSVVIDKFTITPPQMPLCKAQMEGKILLSGQQMKIEHLKTTFHNSPFSLQGRIDNYLKGPLTAELHLSSPSFNLDDILTCRAQERQRQEEEREWKGEEEGKTQGREEIGPFNFKDVMLTADISMESLNYKNMHFTDVKTTCRLKDNVLTLEPLAAKCTNGTLHLKSRIDLGVRGLDYTTQLTGNILQLNPIVTSFAPDLKEKIFGTMDLTAELKGSGTTSQTFKKHLKGEGKISLEQVKVTGLKSLQTLSSFIKMDQLDTLHFDHSQGTFQIHDGLIQTESSLMGKDIELYPQGTISLDSQLDLSLGIKLSPEFSKQIANEALTKYFHDERGWTVITLALKGPTDELVVTPAPSTIKKISEMIIDIILKKDETDDTTRQDKKKALEELLKGFSRKSKEKKDSELPSPK